MAKRSARRLRLRRALRILLLIALLGSVLYLLLEKSLTQVIFKYGLRQSLCHCGGNDERGCAGIAAIGRGV